MALERMPYDVQSHNPDIIIIQFGVNDCNYWQTDKGHPRVSQIGFKANLIEIVERSRIFGAKEIFLNTNNPLPKTPKFQHATVSLSESNEEYNQIVREAAKDSHANLIDIEKYWFDKLKKGLKIEDLVLPDNVHLSVLGHNLYVEIVYPYLEKAVKKLYILKHRRNNEINY
jgi:lysophospholipase L1-like esterase